MERNAAGRLAMTRVVLRPRITFSGSRTPTASELDALHDEAHECCFIAASVTSEVVVKKNRRVSRMGDVAEIVDLDEEKIYHVDFAKKTYKITTFDEMRKQFEEMKKEAAEQADAKPAERDPDAPEYEVVFDSETTGEKDEINGYYNGFCNRALWPLCHTMLRCVTPRLDNWQDYRLINERFADTIAMSTYLVAFVVGPLEATGRDGVIADVDITEVMLRHFLRQVTSKRIFRIKPRVVVGVPSGITELERRAVRSSAAAAGAKEVYMVAEPMAAAIGVGLPVDTPTGNMVIDIGGGTTEIAVIALNGIVSDTSIRVGGDEIDNAIVTFLRKNYNLLIGEPTAEAIKIQIGSAFNNGEEREMEVKGRDLVSGIPKTVRVHSQEIRECIQEPIQAIVEAVRRALEITPPELASDIVDEGIVMTGGGAQLRGLDWLLGQEVSLPIHVDEEPLTCVVRGAGRILDQGPTVSGRHPAPMRDRPLHFTSDADITLFTGGHPAFDGGGSSVAGGVSAISLKGLGEGRTLVLIDGVRMPKHPELEGFDLKAMGHNITAGGRQGDAHSVWVAPDGTIYGINEKRTPDGKASVPQLTTAASGR